MKTFKISSLIFLFFTSTTFGVVFPSISFEPFTQNYNKGCILNLGTTNITMNKTRCEFLRNFVDKHLTIYFDTDFGFGLQGPTSKRYLRTERYSLRTYFINVLISLKDGCYANVDGEVGVMWMKSDLMCFVIQRLVFSNTNKSMTVKLVPEDSSHADFIQEIETSFREPFHDVSVLDLSVQDGSFTSVAKIADFGTNSFSKSYIVMNDKFHPFINNLKLFIENPDTFLRAVDYFLAETTISYTIKRNLNNTYNVIRMVSLHDVIRDESCNKDKRSKRNIEDNAIPINHLMRLYLYSIPSHTMVRSPTVDNPIHHLIHITVPMVDNTFTHLPLVMYATIQPNRVIDGEHHWPSRTERNLRNMGLNTDSDDRGHILARILGGSRDVLNIVPMTRRLNQNPPGNVLSTWRSNEEIMEGFLAGNYGHVEYFVIIQYENLMLSNDPNYRFRPHELHPTHFTQYFSLIFHNGSYTDYGPMSTINSHSVECHDVYSSFD